MIFTSKNGVKSLCFVALVLLGTATVIAQTPDSDTGASGTPTFTEDERDVFAPFVSRLRVAVRDPQVRLTWRDSDDLESGSYRVYRHTEEITRDTIDDAALVAEVDTGVETYLDTPLEEGAYYYAVIAAEESGRMYPIFVPFRNKTIRSVTVAQLETEEDLAASVYGIEALAQDNAVVVRFEASRGGRDLVVYRSTTPLTDDDQIPNATLIDEFGSSTRRFADYPVPGVDYYYGVFDKALVERGSVSVRPGENALATAVRVGLNDATELQIQIPRATKRRAPLPILHLAEGIQSGDRLARNSVPEQAGRILDPATEAAVRALLERAPEPAVFRPEPRVLPEERAADGAGAAYTLAQVVNTEFAAGNYARTADLLRNLLTLPLSGTLERRTRFYLGQALYFDGRRQPAFVEFLLAADGELYTEVAPWIDGILLPRG
ncbi:MAG: hypothetical protein PF508_07635 [Spirochaeta sp.]|jgi:hypothetical protein|nr:hypothetical protein [Spirochaeta sp.]